MDAIAELVSRLGESGVRSSDAQVHDFGKRARAIVYPTSQSEVVDVVRWARAHRVALVPSGGRTGLCGGADAHEGEVVVSLSRMNRILEFNRSDRLLRCEAGAVTQVVQEFAAAQGCYFPVDFASRGSSQVGGNVATNAGGVRVVRYGSFREWVSGLEFVTGAGEVVQANLGLVKNATGYDFRHLMIGSEGTLGIVTQVLLRVTTPPRSRQVFLLALSEDSDLLPLYEELRDRLPLLAFEVFSEDALARVLARRAEGGRVSAHPFERPSALYVLAEIETEETGVLEELLERGWIRDARSGLNERQCSELWSYREEISESLAPRSPYKFDVAVRVSRVGLLVRDLKSLLGEIDPELEVVWFGHLGDGNVHINVLRPHGWESSRFQKACERVSQSLFRLIQKHEGSVSAEHGIGLLKRDALRYSRGAHEVELMRAIKKAFDPDGILNPGKIFI